MTALAYFGALREGPPLTRAEVFARFIDASRHVWGERTVALLLSTGRLVPMDEDIYRDRKVKPLAAVQIHRANVASTLKPYAIGRSLLRTAPGYRLYVSDRLLEQDDASVKQVLLHEAIHLGHFSHTREFVAVAREVGAAISEEGMERGGKVLLERKDPGQARYKVIAEFDTPEEALAHGKAETKRVHTELRDQGVPHKQWPKFRISQ